MKKTIQVLIAALLLGSLTIQADVFTVSWLPPTQYTDNSPLLEQDLDYYTLYVDGVSTIFYDSVPGSYSQLHTIVPAGTYDLTLTVTTLEGVESGPSNVKVFTVGPRTPKPPTLT